MKTKIVTALLSVFLSLSLGACKPSAEREQARYTQAKDRLAALATKNPAMKADIEAKMVEFEKAKKEADAKSGEAAAAALAALNGRIAVYEKMLTPDAPVASDAPVLGSKLNAADAGPPADGGTASKLGGAVDAGAAVDAAPPGKLGGSPDAAPAPTTNKSGFGATPDAAPAAPKSGFGGK